MRPYEGKQVSVVLLADGVRGKSQFDRVLGILSHILLSDSLYSRYSVSESLCTY